MLIRCKTLVTIEEDEAFGTRKREPFVMLPLFLLQLDPPPFLRRRLLLKLEIIIISPHPRAKLATKVVNCLRSCKGRRT